MFFEYPYNLDLLLIVMVLFIGILLVITLRQEIKQRNQMEAMSKQLGGANDELRSVDKARSEFLSIASHQLRSPPSTVKWYLAAVRAGDFGKINPKAKEAIRKAEVANNNQITLIDDLLNVSGIERGKMEFNFEKTDFQLLVKKTVDQLMPQAISKKLKMVLIKPKQKLPKILADPEKLQQVANNLIDNAIKYSKQGKITVKLDKKDDAIILSVSDNGKGMSPEELGAIFEKYKRGTGSFHHAAGLGLGLYVAKVVLDHHHGTIWAESPGVGQGSTFYVSLPINADLSAEREINLTKHD